MEQLQTAEFWWALARIAGVSVVLCAESAIVLTLLSRAAPAERRAALRWGGKAQAIVLRVTVCVAAGALWPLPGVATVVGITMMWFGLRLLVPERVGRARSGPQGRKPGILAAVMLAEAVTATGHGLAIAEAAGGSALLSALGLLLAACLLALPGAVLPRVMRRVPAFVPLSAALLGWGGGGAVGDEVLAMLPRGGGALMVFGGPAGAVIVLAVGWLLAARAVPAPRAAVDLAPPERQ